MPNTEPEINTDTIVHVAVAVIVKDNRVLISKRATNVHQGGLWEFPGGKVERGETIVQALSREIKEELGIQIVHTRPLIKLIHHYPDKSVLLETQIISEFEGKQYSTAENLVQKGLEGQIVKWVKLDELTHYQFPQANKAIIKALCLPDAYLISPDPLSEEADKQAIKQFLQAFAEHCNFQQVIQLRIKSLKQAQLNPMLEQAFDIAAKQQVRVLVNSSMNLKYAISQLSSGIHLTSFHLHDTDFVKHYRDQFAHKMIAASCHCQKDVERANDLELDFIVISPVKETPSHPDQKPMGWTQFKQLTDRAKMPVFALGGMKPGDIKDAQNKGAQGIAAISSLWK
ncbi:MAG: Nudix family hydrolase [gamma proteobacterium symbiont of Bathyaustriella thionipta]|nr:Nudix family hydrolase [gamma proteobacterium symbiont of Bathyaustriella thionipta]MCU7950183.1 Nudix family hydrolase [gamma proteobacterium symbiont of Bathyaustriella thionipta]MCU7953893.1 Nudix family hydrolase [gamma proteobacterium symbiont of Bathyaustriella thionipta]MCU7955011.1 Nudix family hydrolase [gamma proteobacterium symbiont of Bathyaustriella thionipta]MCU7966865.1 Nudix family hydrolase [gamma proteobacterium symbiont of Bathyaustriella thionipta]